MYHVKLSHLKKGWEMLALSSKGNAFIQQMRDLYSRRKE